MTLGKKKSRPRWCGACRAITGHVWSLSEGGFICEPCRYSEVMLEAFRESLSQYDHPESSPQRGQ